VTRRGLASPDVEREFRCNLDRLPVTGDLEEVTVPEFFSRHKSGLELSQKRCFPPPQLFVRQAASYRNFVSHAITCPLDGEPTTNVALQHQPK